MEENKLTAWERMELIRHKGRPTVRDYIPMIFDEFYELHGDRLFGDDAAIVGGIARVHGISVTVLGQVKGHDLEENKKTNFSCPHPEGYRKALRLMQQAEKFQRPIICFVDTSGAYCGIGAEARGQGQAIAENLVEMMGFSVPIISIFIGEGGSGGALALGVANRVWMLEHSVYSVISPEGCASILWKDAKKADEAADNLKLTAQDAYRFGFIEKIISEKDLGSRIFYKDLQKMLIDELKILAQEDDLSESRYRRFRALGAL